MEKLNATEVIGRQIVWLLVESDSESEDEVINSTSSVEYNTDRSSDSGTYYDDNERDSAHVLLPLKHHDQT